ncbi:hypothetical protein MB84_04340 [Pandoraea oxalativorans]|uniref:Methyltransferase domain-containing protein n=1 Tax=Pandoraea oxalativorans TaxID=573737 RepID=A0A0E3YBK9_9BURK|nr:hypothetical protein MB84_04340 [Pandoraea oxalativorans]
MLVFYSCSITSDNPILGDEHTAFEWIDTNAAKPINMPSFYWNACAQEEHAPPSPNYAPMEATDYPLLTGNKDRQRLTLTSEIYNPATTEFLRSFTPSHGRILDVGCGHGQIAQWPAAHSPETAVTGLDNSPEQLLAAESSALAAGLGNIEFRQGDLTDLAKIFRSAPTFELITCRFTLLHIVRRDSAIRALLDLLTPSGTLVIEEPSLDSLFCVPRLTAFEQANAAIKAYGKTHGIDYDCIGDVWSFVTREDVNIRAARFSQPTIWQKQHKALVGLSFRQFSPRLVSTGILEIEQACRLQRTLDGDYMSDLFISGGLRTLQIAISADGASS